MESPREKLERMAGTSQAARDILRIAAGDTMNPVEQLKLMTGLKLDQVPDKIDDDFLEIAHKAIVEHEAYEASNKVDAAEVGHIHYDLMNKLFSSLNDLKGFEVGMNGPREGKLFVNFRGVDFVLEVTPAKSESYLELERQFK